MLKVVADVEARDGKPAGSTPNPALVAAGSVKYMLDVSGMSESNVALQEFSKSLDWEQNPRAICDMRTQSLAASQKALEGNLLSANAVGARQIHFLLGQAYAYQGKMDRAIAEFEKAHQASALGPAAQRSDEGIGIAYLHRAMVDKGVYRRPGDRCLLSAAGLPALTRTADSRKALEHFLRYLAARPDELEVKWLLSLTYMTMGEYAAKAPPAYLIPVTAFASAEDLGRFIDVAPWMVPIIPQAVWSGLNPSSPIMRSRMTNFWIFPVTVIGNSSTNLTYRGTL